MAAEGKKKNPFLAGFLAGLFTGLALAVAVAVLVTRNNPFVEPSASDGGAAPAPAASAPIEAPKYDFGGPPPAAPATPSPAPAPAAAAPAAPVYFLQAGAYGRAEEAEQLKASLALQGFEASIVAATEGDKTLHRVRIGPFKSMDELNSARARLTQSGIETILIKSP